MPRLRVDGRVWVHLGFAVGGLFGVASQSTSAHTRHRSPTLGKRVHLAFGFAVGGFFGVRLRIHQCAHSATTRDPDARSRLRRSRGAAAPPVTMRRKSRKPPSVFFTNFTRMEKTIFFQVARFALGVVRRNWQRCTAEEREILTQMCLRFLENPHDP